MIRIEGETHPQYELTGLKRFYWEGGDVVDECPLCGTRCVLGDGDYLCQYPTVNKPMKQWMYCGDCEHNWEIEVTITLGLSVQDIDG